MLLRFDRDYHDRYIKGISRHKTFKSISYQKTQSLTKNSVVNLEHQAVLLRLLANRSPQDAYYSLQCQDGDYNVIMRLQAWRPRVEILLPYDLRQKIAAEITREFELYPKLHSL
jgi:CRISPR-associated protein (TIGR03985 family)